MNKTITCLLATLLTLTHALAQTDADGVRTWDGGGRMQADICVYGATSGASQQRSPPSGWARA